MPVTRGDFANIEQEMWDRTLNHLDYWDEIEWLIFTKLMDPDFALGDYGDDSVLGDYGTKIIHIAAMQGRADIVKRLIELHADCDATRTYPITGEEFTLLEDAVRSGNLATVALIAEKDTRYEDTNDGFLLCLAAFRGMHQIVLHFITSKKFSPNALDTDNSNVLHNLCEGLHKAQDEYKDGFVFMINHLVNVYSVSVEQRDIWGKAPRDYLEQWEINTGAFNCLLHPNPQPTIKQEVIGDTEPVS